MGRKPKYSKEIKIKTCEDYLTCKDTFAGIAQKLGTKREVVRRWVLTYQKHGDYAFDHSNRNQTYTKEFKNLVTSEYMKGGYSLADLAAKHNVSYSVVRQWVKRYYDGIENKDYKPKGEVYAMNTRKTTYDERVEIVRWVISHDMSYKDAASKYGISYAIIYQWVQKHMKAGPQALEYKRRGPKGKSKVDETSLTEVDRLKLELEREKSLREQAELTLKILKKKEEFEQKLRYLK